MRVDTSSNNTVLIEWRGRSSRVFNSIHLAEEPVLLVCLLSLLLLLRLLLLLLLLLLRCKRDYIHSLLPSSHE